MAFQTVPDTLNQIFLFEHDRIRTAAFLSCRAVVIVILPAFVVVGFPGHAAAAAPADQNTGKQVHLIFLWGSPGIDPLDSLYQVEVVPLHNRFMGVLHPNPFDLPACFPAPFNLKWGVVCSALYQRTRVGLVLQNADDGMSPTSGSPFYLYSRPLHGASPGFFLYASGERTHPAGSAHLQYAPQLNPSRRFLKILPYHAERHTRQPPGACACHRILMIAINRRRPRQNHRCLPLRHPGHSSS